MTNKSTSNEIQTFLEANPSWKVIDSKLHKTFLFENFIEAFGFMSQAALVAERDNHHPEWFNVYKTVIVDLTTHEADGISEKDFSLAVTMDKIAK